MTIKQSPRERQAVHAHLMIDLFRHVFRSVLRRWTNSELQTVAEILDIKLFVRNRFRSCTRFVDHVPPEKLITKERDNQSRPTLCEPDGSGASTTVMNHR